MEIPVILSSGQETESFGAIALSFSAALCLFSQGYLNEKQIFAVAVVTKISLSSSGPCIDGLGFLLFVCVCVSWCLCSAVVVTFASHLEGP